MRVFSDPASDVSDSQENRESVQEQVQQGARGLQRWIGVPLGYDQERTGVLFQVLVVRD